MALKQLHPESKSIQAGKTSKLLPSTSSKADANMNIPMGQLSGRGIQKALIPQFLYKPPYGYPRFIDIPELRRLCATPYVEMCISTIIDEILSVEWQITGKDKEHFDQAHVDDVKAFFDNPNANRESWGDLLKMAVRDVMELDSGVMVKEFDAGKRLTGIYARDGGTFTKNPDIHGTFAGKPEILPSVFSRVFRANVTESLGPSVTNVQSAMLASYFQYGWNTPSMPIPFGFREIIYMIRNPRTDSIYGKAPMEILMDVVQMLVYGIDHNLDYFTDNDVPIGFFKLIGASSEELRQFREAWKENMKKKDEVGNYRKKFFTIPATNTDGEFVRIAFSNAELELISQQQWFTKLVWACFGVTPSELGFTEDSNRAVDISQSRVFRRKAIRPLLKMLEYHINMEIITEFENGVWTNPGTETARLVSGIDDVKFEFITEDVEEEKEKAELQDLYLRNGVKTVNEVREEMGLKPLEGGDQPRNLGMGAGGFMPGETPNEIENQEEYADEVEEGKSLFGQKGKPESKAMTFEEATTYTGPMFTGPIIEMKPFGEYSNFSDCVSKNKDKSNPEAYCASIHKKITGEWPGQKALTVASPLAPKEYETPSQMSRYMLRVFSGMRKAIEDRLDAEKGHNIIGNIKAIDQEFIRRIKESIDFSFAEPRLRASLEGAYLKAIEDLELEFDMNIMPNRETLEFLSKHALEHVRDLEASVKSKLRAELERGLIAGEGIAKLKDRVKQVFDMANARAKMIARTEIARAENIGHLEGYTQTGMKGDTEWVAKIDERTCEVCRKLDGSKAKLGGKFSEKSFEGHSPPAHPNCRCRLVFVPE